jgi:outer membrane protein assembly factor BamB
LALAAGAQSNPPRRSSDSFHRAAGVPADKPSEFQFSLGRFDFHVKPNGNGQRVKGEDVRRFSLHFGPGEEMKYLYFASYRGGVLLTCEVLGEYGGTSYAVRLDQPSMRARWTANIPATLTGEPARDGSRLYVTGKNFAGALDLESGELLWYVDEFPGRAEEFDSFDAPEPRGREVLFRTRPVYNGKARAVVVDAKTGKVVRVE